MSVVMAADRISGMKKTDRVRLLGAPYHPPAVQVGERVTCLYRDCDVVVTTWKDARISWSMGVQVGGKGAPGIIVDAELARAVRTESAAALRYW
jgi:hypothetical protein